MSVVASPVSPSSLAADDRKWHRPPGPLLGFAPADAERILAHLVALDVDDRFLRFGYGIGDEGIARYVARIDFARDHVHGLTDAGGRVVALAHMAVRDGEVDFGLSVAPAWRRRGLGRILFAHVVELASLLRAQRVLCHSISPAVLHMAGACGFLRAGGNPAAPLVLDIPVC
ncbi:MAG: GNAT family N-acetyltransferase [Thauera sp.]|nr:GNAT family N-acetyltransferase [Thauera sp.]